MKDVKVKSKFAVLAAAFFVIAGVLWVILGSLSLNADGADEPPDDDPEYLFMPILVRNYPEAMGEAFYVSPSGNNSNPGTFNRPWRTVSFAVSNQAVKPGDTVYIRAGTYNEIVDVNISGAPGKPITIRNYPGEHPVFRYGTDPNERWKMRIADHSHLRIQGLTWDTYHGGAIGVYTDEANVTDVQVIDCTFKHQRPFGPQNKGSHTVYFVATPAAYMMTDVAAIGNRFEDINTCYGATGSCSETLTATGHVRRVRFLNNTLVDVSNIGIDIIGRDGIGYPWDVLIKGNAVINNGMQKPRSAAHIYLDGPGGNVIIEDNVLYDGENGIVVSMESNGQQADHIIVRRNVSYRNWSGAMVGAGGAIYDCATKAIPRNVAFIHNTLYATVDDSKAIGVYCSEHVRFRNNIVAHVANGNGRVYSQSNPTAVETDWIYDDNLHWTAGAGTKYWTWFGTTARTLAQFQANSGQDLNSVYADPLFVDPAAGDFRLGAGSPAIDAGAPLAQVLNTGSGTVIAISDARYFTDGWGLQPGDTVRIGDDVVTVVDVDYGANTLTVDRSISWSAGEAVNYDYVGSGPDVGAYEMGATE